VLRSSPPLTFRRAAGDLHLVGTAAGPVGGDELRLAVDVDPDAELTVRSVAASMAFPGPTGAASSLTIDVTVGAGGTLRWLVQPTVLVQGCDHRVVVRARLASGASLVWREQVVSGRHEEPGGSLLQRLRVDLAGRPLLRSDVAVGPAWPGSLGPAGLAGARAFGTLLVVGRAVPDVCPPDGVRLAVSALEGPAVLVTAVADRPSQLTAALDRALIL
jgi:urease accessory protein